MGDLLANRTPSSKYFFPTRKKQVLLEFLVKFWRERTLTSGSDIYRTANILIQQHGDEASIHAARPPGAY